MKIMFKKTLYPFTDWKWLLLPLASVGIGGFLLMMWLGMFALMAYHKEYIHGQLTVFAIAYFATMIGIFIFAFSCAGYLLRVARQPRAEQPLKLPNWSGVASMVKEGFLASFGTWLLLYFVSLISLIPFFLSLVVAGGLNHRLLEEGLTWLGTLGLVVVAGCGLVGYLAVFLWLMLFQPLLLVRYAYTGKFRHLLSPRWAWRAFTIAPWEYLARTAVWTIYLVLITILTPLTMGVAYIIAYVLMPLSMINCAYMVGDYYAVYLDD